MSDQKKTEEMFGQLTGKMVETMTVWADANQRVFHELVELSTATAKEGVKLCGELQQGAIETLRSSQSAAVRWQGRGTASGFRVPLGCARRPGQALRSRRRGGATAPPEIRRPAPAHVAPAPAAALDPGVGT